MYVLKIIFLNITDIYKIIGSTRTSVHITIDVLIYSLVMLKELIRVDRLGLLKLPPKTL